jgi:hypothetical protein
VLSFDMHTITLFANYNLVVKFIRVVLAISNALNMATIICFMNGLIKEIHNQRKYIKPHLKHPQIKFDNGNHIFILGN